MAKGEGKGWAKGRSAESDARIARNALARTGLVYRSHVPPELDRRQRYRRTLPLEWSDAMAYVVGLTATDGCLFTGFRKINFKSADRDLVGTYLRVLGRTNPIKAAKSRTGGVVYFTEFGDAHLYRWLESVGLTPRKSLTLGAIAAPDRLLAPLMRGLFDGDGSIANFVHRPTTRTYPDYLYERLWVFFNSASRSHVEWLQERSHAVFGVNGYVDVRPADATRHEFYRLKFGKHDSIVLLRALYPTPAVPKLERKWIVWESYRIRNSL